MSNTEKMTLSKLVKSSEFANWCQSAVVEVFESLFFVEADVQAVQLTDYTAFEVSAVVAFMSDEIEAIMQLSCSRTTIYNLSTSLTGDPMHDERNILCLGEAINIVFGMLKENLNAYNLEYEKCLPIVIFGQNHIILNLNKTEAYNTVYKTPYGLFNLKVGFNQKSASTKAA